METSDSEYFESADEDFQSDDEDTKTVRSVTNDETSEKCVKSATTQLKNVEIGVDDNKSSGKSSVDNVRKDDENNVSTSKARNESSKKLGTRLSKKSDSVEKHDDIKVVEAESRKPDINPASKDTISNEENLWDESEDWGHEKEEENMWDNDEWEAVDEPSSQPEEKVPQSNTAWGSWGNWGVSSILTTATQSVSSITQGITTVLETGIGVPEPEELARINQTEKQKLKELSPDTEDKSTGFGLNNLVMGVSHLTKLVETTSTKVISGGLDTLETIGKKTMEVLQEGDPGLKKKRAFLKIDQDKPVLSQLLREAKEKAEEENKVLEEKHFAKKAKNYETLFDDHQGLVHLEALEMLSKQCDIKLQTLLESYSGESLTEMQETMDQVKELCELPDEDEDEQTSWSEILEKLNSAVSEINIPISYKKLVDTWEETEVWLNHLKLEVCDERELHQQAVETLAQLTALAVEQFHKAGELLLVKEHRSTADEADSLVQLTTSLTSLIGIVAAKFSEKLNAKSSNSKNKEAINGLITTVFFEAANSSSYIQDAFQLLVPVLQVGAV
ncbi:protein FAM114A2 [Zophobas morio]|uniref:protein FAM114A2 n=1 Tax=Zophobas morio TaxID=2755281 RepID=UPI0030828D19